MTGEPISAESAPVAATWQQLDDLVDEMARLVDARLQPRDFWQQLLDRTVRALAASAAAVCMRNADGTFSPHCRVVGDDALAEPVPAETKDPQLCAHVADTRLALALPPRSGAAGTSDNPTPYLLLLAPVVVHDETLAVVEVYQRPSELPTAAEGYLRFLAAVCELAADYERGRQFHQLRAQAGAGMEFDRFLQAVHNSLSTRHVAYTIANDGRVLVGSDRLSVAIVRGRRCRLESISGVDQVNPRAPGVRRLERLIDAVVAIDEPLVYPDAAEQLPPQLVEALESYVDESHACQLMVLPLHAPDDAASEHETQPVIGALVCESFTSRSNATSNSTRLLASHAAIALANALEFESAPLARLWRIVRRSRFLVHRRQLPKTLALAVAAAAIAAALAFIPVDLTVEGRGELLPERRRQVFATVDGVVSEVRVAHGDTVEAGQTLLVLRRPQLEFERTRATGELQTARKRLAALTASRFGGAAASAEARDQYHQRSADEEEVKQLLKSLGEQLAALDRQDADLTILSPLAGQVLTWDVAQSLEARPVQRGQELLSVGETDGPWELELRIDDDRIGHVLAARETTPSELEISYFVAMASEHVYAAQLRDVAMTTDAVDRAGPQVLVTASLDPQVLPPLRPGASVVAKIHCGRRSLGYVWFHELWNAVRNWLFF